jgi:hypothetical protein
MTQARIEQQGEATAVGGVPRGSSWVALLEAGAVTGAAGGALMMATLMVQSAAMGYGALFPLNLVGATFRGPEALVGGAEVMLSGLLLHALTSLVFGTLFSMAVLRRPRLAPTLVVGIAYGLLILLFMTYVVLPYANPIMRQRVIGAPGTWFFCHVAFGLGVGTAPIIKRLFRSRRETRDESIIAADQ